MFIRVRNIPLNPTIPCSKIKGVSKHDWNIGNWHFHFFHIPARFLTYTAQKIEFFIKDFFSKCDQICFFLRIWSHLLKKSLMEKFTFRAELVGLVWVIMGLVSSPGNIKSSEPSLTIIFNKWFLKFLQTLKYNARSYLWWHQIQKQPPEVFFKKGVLNYVTKLTVKHPCRRHFFK